MKLPPPSFAAPEVGRGLWVAALAAPAHVCRAAAHGRPSTSIYLAFRSGLFSQIKWAIDRTTSRLPYAFQWLPRADSKRTPWTPGAAEPGVFPLLPKKKVD